MKIVRSMIVFALFLAVCATGATALTPKIGLGIGYDTMGLFQSFETEGDYSLSRTTLTPGISANIDASLALNTESSEKPFTLYGSLQFAFPGQVKMTDTASTSNDSESLETTGSITSGNNIGYQLGFGWTYFNKRKANFFCGLGFFHRTTSLTADYDQKDDDDATVISLGSDISGSCNGLSLLLKLDVFFNDNIGMYLAADGGMGIGSCKTTKEELKNDDGGVFFVNPRIGAVYRF